MRSFRVNHWLLGGVLRVLGSWMTKRVYRNGDEEKRGEHKRRLLVQNLSDQMLRSAISS